MPPKINCEMTECIFNEGGECNQDEIDINYSGACETFEAKGRTDIEQDR